MSGYFGAISKAPLTAMILVTEMVGDIRNLNATWISNLGRLHHHGSTQGCTSL